MREVTFELFTFDELSEEAKKKAVEEYLAKYGDELFGPYEVATLSDYFIGRLARYGYEDMEVFWSLGHSQGDGMRFEGEMVDEDTIHVAKRLLEEEDFKKYAKIVEELGMVIQIVGTTHQYYHYNTMAVNFDLDKGVCWDHFDDYEYERVLDRLYEKIKLDIIEISEELEAEGYEHIDYHYTEENVKNVLSINEWEFYEDGSIY